MCLLCDIIINHINGVWKCQYQYEVFVCCNRLYSIVLLYTSMLCAFLVCLLLYLCNWLLFEETIVPPLDVCYVDVLDCLCDVCILCTI